VPGVTCRPVPAAKFGAYVAIRFATERAPRRRIPPPTQRTPSPNGTCACDVPAIRMPGFWPGNAWHTNDRLFAETELEAAGRIRASVP